MGFRTSINRKLLKIWDENKVESCSTLSIVGKDDPELYKPKAISAVSASDFCCFYGSHSVIQKNHARH